MADYGSSNSGASLGDILGAAIRKAEGDIGRDDGEEPETIEKSQNNSSYLWLLKGFRLL